MCVCIYLSFDASPQTYTKCVSVFLFEFCLSLFFTSSFVYCFFLCSHSHSHSHSPSIRKHIHFILFIITEFTKNNNYLNKLKVDSIHDGKKVNRIEITSGIVTYICACYIAIVYLLSEFEIEFRQKMTTTPEQHAQSKASERYFYFWPLKSK